MSEEIRCSNCRELKEVGDVKNMRCVDCCELKQFKIKEKKTYTLKRTKINSISAKEKINKANKMKTYKKIGDPKFCQTCGRTNRPLSRSHIIPVSYNKKLEDVELNIIVECYGGSDCCHDIWEHGTWEEKKELSNFQKRLDIITRLDPSYFNLISP